MISLLLTKPAFFIDSDEKKHGTEYQGLPVLSLKDACGKRDSYDKIIIGALAYQEMRKTLLQAGFTDQDIILPVYQLYSTD